MPRPTPPGASLSTLLACSGEVEPAPDTGSEGESCVDTDTDTDTGDGSGTDSDGGGDPVHEARWGARRGPLDGPPARAFDALTPTRAPSAWGPPPGR